MRRSIVSEEARARQSSVVSKSLPRVCIVRCSDSEFSLWQIFSSTVRGLTKFKTWRSLSDEHDGWLGDWILRAFDPSRRLTWQEKKSICSSTPLQDHGGYILNSSLLESDLKVTKCNAMPFLRTCMRRKWMWFWSVVSFKITAEIEITEHMFCVLPRRRGLSAFCKA